LLILPVILLKGAHVEVDGINNLEMSIMAEKNTTCNVTFTSRQPHIRHMSDLEHYAIK